MEDGKGRQGREWVEGSKKREKAEEESKKSRESRGRDASHSQREHMTSRDEGNDCKRLGAQPPINSNGGSGCCERLSIMHDGAP